MKTTTAAMNEWILRREINAYIKRRTCPFCGGTLSGRHPREENGRILPMTYVCRQCGQNPREALASENHKPAGHKPGPRGERAMSKSKTQKSPEKKSGGQKHEQAPDAARIEAARTPDVHTLGKDKVAQPQTEEAIPEIVVFAFRLTRAERDEIHAATGSAKASRFIRTIALAGARNDMKAVQEAVGEVHASSK